MKYFIYKIVVKYFLKDCSDYNPLIVRQSCRSKQQARKAFKKLKIPYAKGDIFFNPFKVLSFVRKNGFPVVIKPNIGGFSRGAYFPITNLFQLVKASFAVKKWWFSSVIEEYLEGNNYRIVVVKEDIMTIAKRFPPFVIGDGINTISTLIDIENKKRIEKKLLPILKAIPKNRKIKKYLKQANKTLSFIPKKSEQVFLYNKISLNLGSSIEIISKNTLTKYNKQQLFKILDYFDANILGIDVICQKELDIDFNQQKCIFLEVNSRPYLKMHEYPRYGKKEDLSYYFNNLKTTNAKTF
ncbi:Glutamate--cysteine ligase [hydrothermal vent metagenome]|uniref:Glutamate--cysteine ligase n=1 Tax=hydrothermal vent metagenome TaxID=652676 RepID=A0A1W1BS98_9ZZZZ